MYGIIALAAGLGALLLSVAWRNLKHEKTIRGSSLLVLIGGVAATLAASVVVPGLFRALTHGYGLILLLVVLGACGTDFYWQVVQKAPIVVKNKEMLHRTRTPWVASLGLAIALGVLAVSYQPIWSNIRSNVTGHHVTQVLDHVNHGGS